MIEWLTAESVQRAAVEPREYVTGRALVTDLRDPRILPLLRPAPTASDYADERRPGASDRSYFLARRAALRSLVALYAQCDADEVTIGYDAPGAPRVTLPQGCFVSVSGRGPYAALAVSSAPIGIDLEFMNRDVEVIDDVLHPAERAEIARLPNADRADRFLRIWTAKEAFLKAQGTGLTEDPARIRVEFAGEGIRNIMRENEGARQAFAAGSFFDIRLDGQPMLAACVILAVG